jgi:hypothetical protein
MWVIGTSLDIGMASKSGKSIKLLRKQHQEVAMSAIKKSSR